MSSQYFRRASVNHIGSTHGDRLSRHPAPANHYSDTLHPGTCETTILLQGYRRAIDSGIDCPLVAPPLRGGRCRGGGTLIKCGTFAAVLLRLFGLTECTLLVATDRLLTDERPYWINARPGCQICQAVVRNCPTGEINVRTN